MVRRVERECGDVIWVYRVAHETSRRVRVQPDHEEECQVVGVPECLEALLSDRRVCRGVQQEHDEQHPTSQPTYQKVMTRAYT